MPIKPIILANSSLNSREAVLFTVRERRRGVLTLLGPCVGIATEVSPAMTPRELLDSEDSISEFCPCNAKVLA